MSGAHEKKKAPLIRGASGKRPEPRTAHSSARPEETEQLSREGMRTQSVSDLPRRKRSEPKPPREKQSRPKMPASTEQKLCYLELALLIALSFALMLGSVANYDANAGSRLSGYLSSALLWLLIAGAVAVWFVLRKKVLLRVHGDRSEAARRFRNSRCGLLCFARNREALIAEIACAVGLLLILLTETGLLRFPHKVQVFPYSLALCGFLLHCFLNGKPYLYIQKREEQTKRKEDLT